MVLDGIPRGFSVASFFQWPPIFADLGHPLLILIHSFPDRGRNRVPSARITGVGQMGISAKKCWLCRAVANAAQVVGLLLLMKINRSKNERLISASG